MKRFFLLVMITLMGHQAAVAQKVKYNDIYEDLTAGNYTVAGPRLRIFLADEKKKEHANANWQMARMLEKDAASLNITLDSTRYIRYADSITTFYRTALLYLTDKEVKKNKAYYQEYNRRDRRTGEVGIIRSDITKDLEKKILEFSGREALARSLALRLPRLEKLLKQQAVLYTEIVGELRNKKTLALATREKTAEDLGKLKKGYANTLQLVDEIQNIVSNSPQAGFNADEKLLEIKDIKADGREVYNVYEGEFKLWNYRRLADEILSLSEGKMQEFREALTRADDAAEAAYKLLKQGEEIDDYPEVPEELQELVLDIDPRSLALAIIDYKTAKAQFIFTENNSHELGQNVYLQLAAYDTLQQVAVRADKAYRKIKELNQPVNRRKYTDYISKNFGLPTNIQRYTDQEIVWLSNKVSLTGKKYHELSSRSRWGTADYDSIAMFTEPELQPQLNHTLFLDADTLHYTIAGGIGKNRENDKLRAFVARISPAMQVMWKHEFDPAIKLENISSAYDTLSTENYSLMPAAPGQVAFSYTADEKNYRFVSVDATYGNVNWEVTTQLNAPVKEVQYIEINGETIITLRNKDESTPVYVAIDSKGKLKK